MALRGASGHTQLLPRVASRARAGAQVRKVAAQAEQAAASVALRGAVRREEVTAV